MAKTGVKRKIWHVIVMDTKGKVEPMAVGPVQQGDEVWFHPADTELEVEVFLPFNTPFDGKYFKKGKKQSVKQEVTVHVDSEMIFGYGTPNLGKIRSTGPEIIVDPGKKVRTRTKRKTAGKKR